MMARMGEDSRDGRWHTEFVSKNGAQQVWILSRDIGPSKLARPAVPDGIKGKVYHIFRKLMQEFQCPNPSLQLVKADLLQTGNVSSKELWMEPRDYDATGEDTSLLTSRS